MSPFQADPRGAARAPERSWRRGRGRAAGVACVAVLSGAMLTACGGEKSASTGGTPASSSTTEATQTATASSMTTSTSTVVTGTIVSPGLVKASAGGLTATLRAGTDKPHVNAAWPIHFTVIEGGSPAKATVSYEYLFNGAVVAKRSHYAFSGHFSDIFRWPPSAVGYPLTFRAVIVASGRTLYLDYPVEVQR